MALFRGEVAELKFGQTLVDFDQFVDHGATSDLSRVSGQHQLNVEIANGLRRIEFTDRLLRQFSKQATNSIQLIHVALTVA
ncbi:phosphoenolpyruvate carboxylase domain protein [Vibrio paracholerae]|nr:phosphoenolpyruvate carboxylase domain protein [Vibrio paracholerae]